jgi:hypothetical protein
LLAPAAIRPGATKAQARLRDRGALALQARSSYISAVTTRRRLFAAALLPALASEARAFRLVPADRETERLLADRAAACSLGSEHARLRAELLSALARAGSDKGLVAAVEEALGACPWCGCNLIQPPGASDTPGPF